MLNSLIEQVLYFILSLAIVIDAQIPVLNFPSNLGKNKFQSAMKKSSTFIWFARKIVLF